VGLNESAERHDEPFEILAGRGAAPVVRRSAFEVDEDYFLSREEAGLCWRIWLRRA
jgi:GT2 family glycosyltransferase